MAFIEFILAYPALIASPLISVLSNQAIKEIRSSTDLEKELFKVKKRTLNEYKSWRSKQITERKIGDIGRSIIPILKGEKLELNEDQKFFLNSFEKNLWRSDAWRYLFGKRVDSRFNFLEEKIEDFCQRVEHSNLTEIYEIINNYNDTISHVFIKLQNKILDGQKEIKTGISDAVDKLDLLSSSKEDYKFIKDTFLSYKLRVENKIKKKRYGYQLSELFLKPFVNCEFYSIGIIHYPIEIINRTYSISSQNGPSPVLDNLIFLSGDPGVGKTTLINFAIEVLDFKRSVGVIINLNQCNEIINSSFDIQNLILRELRLDKTRLTFENLIDHHDSFHLIFDGLDEFNPTLNEQKSALSNFIYGVEEFIEEFESYIDLYVTICGRPIVIREISTSDDLIVNVLPLHNDRVKDKDLRKELIYRFGLGKDHVLRSFILCTPNSDQYAITIYPLLLSEILYFYKTGNTAILTSENKFDLYFKIITFYANREVKKGLGLFENSDQFLEKFSIVAYTAWREGEVKSVSSEHLSETEIQLGDNSKFAKRNYVKMTNESELEFNHKTFGEFFASNYFISEFQKITSQEFNFTTYLKSFYTLFHKQQISYDQHIWVKNAVLTSFNLKQLEHENIRKFLLFFQELTFEIFNKPIEKIYNVINDQEHLDIGIFNLFEGLFSFFSSIYSISSICENNLYLNNYKFRNKLNRIENYSFFKKWFNKIDSMHRKYKSYGTVLKDILDKTYLWNSNFQYRDFSNANFEGAELLNSNLENTILLNAKLKETKFNNAFLQNANLSGADLTGADLSGADLSNANLSNATLTGANLKNTILKGANLSSANFHNIQNLNASQLVTIESLRRANNLTITILEDLLKENKLPIHLRREIDYILLS